MEISFIGVGSAWEPELGNASVLLRNQTSLLVDCGFGVPAKLFETPDFAEIDGIYLTHFHGDHTFGIPCLLGALADLGREKLLTFIGQPGTEQAVKNLMDTACYSFLEQQPFPLEFVENNEEADFNEYKLAFAQSAHPQPNYAIRANASGKCVGISGDGAITPETSKLFRDCSILVHECYRYEEEIIGHGIATALVDSLKDNLNLKGLYLTHLHPIARKAEREKMLSLANKVSFDIHIAELGDSLQV